MENIYICHQYYEPSHFKALYDGAREYGYKVHDLIVLNPKSAVQHRERLIVEKGEEFAEKWYENNFMNQGKLWLLKNEIIIIGVAPYDRLLAQYQGVLEQNHSIYMTSCTEWHSGKVPYPYEENKKAFLYTLTHCIDGVACVSRETEQQVSSWNRCTEVVNHALNTREYVKKENFKRKGKYIFLGRLVEVKNIGVIIGFLKLFPEANIEIDIAGEGPLKSELENYAKQDARFHILGSLSKENIKAHLHEYDYLILPSYHEPFGIVLLEALACGVPCIVSNLEGPMEIISHNETGIVFDLEEEDGFSCAMKYSMELGDIDYARMSKSGVAESQRYDVKEVAKKWIALFEKVYRSKC